MHACTCQLLNILVNLRQGLPRKDYLDGGPCAQDCGEHRKLVCERFQGQKNVDFLEIHHTKENGTNKRRGLLQSYERTARSKSDVILLSGRHGIGIENGHISDGITFPLRLVVACQQTNVGSEVLDIF